MKNIFCILICLLFCCYAIDRRNEKYMKLRDIVQVRKQATIIQYKDQEIRSQEFHDQIIQKIQIIVKKRDETFEEWKVPRSKLLLLKQITTLIETLMSLLKHTDALFQNHEFMEGILSNQRELEQLSIEFDDWILIHQEISNLRYLKYLSLSDTSALGEVVHRLQRIVYFFQPYEKQQEDLRINFSLSLSGLTQQIKNLLEQLELNQDAVELDQYELDKQLLLHNYEIDLIDEELIQLVNKKGLKRDLL